MTSTSLQHQLLRSETRRHFFRNCGIGVGAIALSDLLQGGASTAAAASVNPLQPKITPLLARAKRVIHLFMAGGPSQLDMFDYKPMLSKLNGQPIPQSYIEGKRFAFMNSSHKTNLLGSKSRFRQYGDRGAWVCDFLPHTGRIVDKLTFLHTCKTDLFNHAPAKLFMNTGTGLFGRPSLGAWLTYGLGSECDNLPGFVVLQSGPRGPRGGATLWGSGVLPTTYQGVPLRNQGEPILNLTNPDGVDQQVQVLDAVRQLNAQRFAETGDEEISTRLNAYEMAYRMQTSAPELMDTGSETPETLAMYGIKDPGESSFARNCLLARRLVERGVRFIQLYHTNWDHHGGVTENLEEHLPSICREIDQPGAALVRDLEQRGLLEDTIVMWGGEFGRTPMGEVRDFTGRNHHIDAFTMWFAGGGFKPGIAWGETDDFGFGPVGEPAHVRDIHATLLHQLGLNHERLSVRSQGLDVRLTGVLPSRVISELLT
ncbi:MAG: DUF1501 domain-containing protein [Planctomycetaceae bacterium]